MRKVEHRGSRGLSQALSVISRCVVSRMPRTTDRVMGSTSTLCLADFFATPKPSDWGPRIGKRVGQTCPSDPLDLPCCAASVAPLWQERLVASPVWHGLCTGCMGFCFSVQSSATSQRATLQKPLQPWPSMRKRGSSAMKSTISTRGVDVSGRSRHWHETIARTYFPLDLTFQRPEAFDGELTSWDLGRCVAYRG